MSLTGHGEVRMAPDLAIVTVGVMSSAATAREALDANTKAMQGVMASLKECRHCRARHPDLQLFSEPAL